MRWLDDPAVQGAISVFAKNREVKLTVHRSKDKSEDFGFRQQRFRKSSSVGEVLKTLGWPAREISLFVGTNNLNWNLMRLPPPLRSRGVTGFNKDAIVEYRNFWKDTLTREKCKALQVDFETIWNGKDMVWDIDLPQHPGAAFGVTNEIAKFLESTHGLHPQIVFSGSKGFHLWLHADEAKVLATKVSPYFSPTYDKEDDALRYQSKIYRTVVEAMFDEATTGTKINYLDLAPVQRQGVIRCPYSIHPKTGQVVWPLDAEERLALEQLISKNFEVTLWEIVTTIHPWTKTNEIDREDFPEMGIHPFREVWQRGFPMWQTLSISKE
jgi:hypothetical protein